MQHTGRPLIQEGRTPGKAGDVLIGILFILVLSLCICLALHPLPLS